MRGNTLFFLFALLVVAVLAGAFLFLAPGKGPGVKEGEGTGEGFSVDLDGDGERDVVTVDAGGTELNVYPDEGRMETNGWVFVDEDGDGVVDSFSPSSGGSGSGVGGGSGGTGGPGSAQGQDSQGAPSPGGGEGEEVNVEGEGNAQGGEAYVPKMDFSDVCFGCWDLDWASLFREKGGQSDSEEDSGEGSGERVPHPVVINVAKLGWRFGRIPIGDPVQGDNGEVGLPVIDLSGMEGSLIDFDGDWKFDAFQWRGGIYFDDDEDGEADRGVVFGRKYDGMVDWERKRVYIDVGKDGDWDIQGERTESGWRVCVDLDGDGACDVKVALDDQGNVLDYNLDYVDLANSVDPEVLGRLGDQNFLGEYIRGRYGDYLDAGQEMWNILEGWRNGIQLPRIEVDELNVGIGVEEGEEVNGERAVELCRETAREMAWRICEGNGDLEGYFSEYADERVKEMFLQDVNWFVNYYTFSNCERHGEITGMYDFAGQRLPGATASVYARWTKPDGTFIVRKLFSVQVYCDYKGRVLYAYGPTY